MEFTTEPGIVSLGNISRITASDNLFDLNSSGLNGSELNSTGGGITESDYIFDRWGVRAIFISLYTIVFCSCFFGNLMVILVVTLHWRMRSITNFCLANLAFADLCVGIFCVYQNLSTYLIASWVFGDFLCKMYHFINSLSHTASILILVVICVERYLAIIHPMRCKQMLTLGRLRLTIVLVWITSAVYSTPRLYYITTVAVNRIDGETEVICIPKRTLYDSVTFDLISMVVLFIVPLAAIIMLYTRIGIALWRSSKTQMPSNSGSDTSSSSLPDCDNSEMRRGRGGARNEHGKWLWCCGGCESCYWKSSSWIGSSWRRRQSRRRRNSSCLYHGSSSTAASGPHTRFICYRYSPGGDSLEDNGNRERHITSCSQCDCDHGRAIPLRDVIEDNGWEEDDEDEDIRSYDSPPRNNGCSPCAKPLTVPVGTCSQSTNIKGRKRSRTSSDLTGSPEPLIHVKFKKGRASNSSRGDSHCSISIHGEGGTMGSCGAEGGNLDGFRATNEAENNRQNLFLNDCRGNRLKERTIIEEDSLTNGHNGNVNGLPRRNRDTHNSVVCTNSGTRMETNNVRACGGSCIENGGQRSNAAGLASSMSRRNCSCAEIGGKSAHNNPTHRPPRLRRMRVVRGSKYGTRALQSRRRIIRMLIVIVVAFFVCNLPFHARKMWQNYSKSYQGGSTFSSILTPVTFLIMYANSGINPLLYAFMSHRFRLSFRDLLCCKIRRSLRSSSRRPSIRSTHVVPVSTAV